MANITLFAQAIGKLPKEYIRKIIREEKTDKHCKGYDTWSQFISMMFCQFSGCDSVRDISNGLNSANGNLNHLGICRAPSKSTVSYQNANRSSAVFRRIFYALAAYFGQQECVFFVMHKDNLLYSRVKELPLPEKRAQNVLIDEIIELTGMLTRGLCAKPLRRMAVWHDGHGYVVRLLTNNFKLAASTIAELYKARWMIEMFFRNIKQLLKIKSFIGTSRNADVPQIWTALSTILLLC